MSEPSKKAWVTLLTNEGYLRGVLTLAFSLQKSGTKYPFYAMYTDVISCSRRADGQTLEERAVQTLVERGISVIRLEEFIPEVDYKMVFPRYTAVWYKLAIYGLEGFDRIAFLDADMLVRKNMDEVMDICIPKDTLAACHACVCNPRENKHFPPSWVPKACAYTYQSYPQCVNETMPTRFPHGLAKLNGGLQIYRPSRPMFERISEVLKNGKPDEFPFPDQDVLAKAFYEEWVPLPYIYNALEPMKTAHPQVWRDEDVKNVHYLFEKPWTLTESQRRETHVWWWAMDEERQRKEKEIGLVEPEWC